MLKTVTIHTDGACKGNPGPGGWCCILEHKQTQRALSGGEAMTTNNRMELTAIIKGLQALKEACAVTVYSDSKYVVDAVTKGWLASWKSRGWRKSDGKPALNVDLWQELFALLETHRVRFIWIKGHDGNPLNEECDRLAVEQAEKFLL